MQVRGSGSVDVALKRMRGHSKSSMLPCHSSFHGPFSVVSINSEL